MARAASARVRAHADVMDSLPVPRSCAMGSRCTQAPFLDGAPARLRSTSKSQLCSRCEEEGLRPHGDQALCRLSVAPLPKGEELKARAFKDDLTVQLFLRKGPFWEAIKAMREKRGIVASTQLPPSGPGISELIFPETHGDEERDFFERYDEWVADLREVKDRCVPARLRDAAEWEAFISACVLCDPPREHLDTFTRHGDPRLLDYEHPGAQGERAPMQARAPVQRMVTEEEKLEEVHFWLLNSLLEELGRRYLEPAGIDVEEAVKDIMETTDLNEEYHRKKSTLRREWHIIAAEGVTADDANKTASMLPTVREARSPGGRASRNRLVALQCAMFCDASDPSTVELPKSESYRILAARYNIPENEIDKYARLGRDLIADARQD